MPIYRYKGANARGELITGVLSAKSSDEVTLMMRGNRQLPIEIKEANTAADKRSLTLINPKVTVKNLSVLCNQFHTLIKSGITIIQCIDVFRNQSENPLMRKAFEQVYTDIQTGAMLSEALRKHPKVFPEFMVNMIESGEMSGNLDIVTSRLASHYDKENKTQNRIRSAMVYPIMLSVIAVAVAMGLMVFVIPTFVSLFEEAGSELPLPTVIMLACSNFIISRWYVLALVATVIAILVPPLLSSPGGRLFKDKLVLRIPVINNMTRKVSASRFSRTLSTLLYSGVPLLQSLDITAKIIGNKVYESMLTQTSEEVKKGSDLATPIELSGLFEPILYNMIRIGEQSGLLDETLERAADLYDVEVDEAVSRLSTVLEPVMIVIMALVVGAIVISIALPMFSMYNNIQF